MNIHFIKNYDFSIYSLQHKQMLKDDLLIRFNLRKIYKKNPSVFNKALRKKLEVK